MLLALSACGTPDQPKRSAVEPPPTLPATVPAKEAPKAELVKADTSKQAPKQPWHYNYALAANGGTASRL